MPNAAALAALYRALPLRTGTAMRLRHAGAPKLPPHDTAQHPVARAALRGWGSRYPVLPSSPFRPVPLLLLPAAVPLVPLLIRPPEQLRMLHIHARQLIRQRH